MPSPDDTVERQACVGVVANDVYVRAAKVTDAAALIKLNEEFRENMLRWQQDDDDAEYPKLDYDDVEFILKEEDNQNLIVLCEKPIDGRRHPRIIGYSYAYDEPWEATEERAGKKEKSNGKGKHKDANTSLYIAEVVVSPLSFERKALFGTLTGVEFSSFSAPRTWIFASISLCLTGLWSALADVCSQV